MSAQADQLLLARRRLTLDDGITPVDTGLRQANLAGEPPLGGADPTATSAGTASRVQVQPLAPISPWVDGDVRHSEPYLNEATGTVWVDFWVDASGPVDVNVLFWDPHTAITPMDADGYNEFACVAPAQVSSATGNNNTPIAAGTAFNVTDPSTGDGQLVIAMFALRAFGDFADPVSDPVLSDAGWTTLQTGSCDLGGGDGMKFIVAYRVSEASDPASFACTSGGVGWRGVGFFSSWRQFDPDAPIQDSAVGTPVTVPVDPLVLQAPSLTVPPTNLPMLLCGYISSTFTFTFTSNSGMTSLGSVSSGSGARTPGAVLSVFRQTISVDGPTGLKQATRDDTANTSTAGGVAFSLTIAPACGIFPDGSNP